MTNDRCLMIDCPPKFGERSREDRGWELDLFASHLKSKDCNVSHGSF